MEGRGKEIDYQLCSVRNTVCLEPESLGGWWGVLYASIWRSIILVASALAGRTIPKLFGAPLLLIANELGKMKRDASA